MNKNILSSSVLMLALLGVSNTASSSNITLDWKHGSDALTATFTGTVHGNVITNIDNVSVWLNGTAYTGNGGLFTASYTGSTWVETGAQVSFDGSENNFVFSDSNPAYAAWTNMFGDISPILGGSGVAQIGRAPSITAYVEFAPGDYSAGVYSVTVPEPASISLIASGFIGFRIARGKPA